MRKAKSDKSFDESSSSSSSSSITMPADLPQEIIEEILSRLPAKSLVRFSSVSKQWRSLISNPKFIKTNLNHLLLEDQSSNNNNHHRLLLLRSPSTLYSVDYNVSPNPIPVRRNFPLLAVEPQALMIIGSCHGMLLIRVNKKSFYLWNPLFRDHTRLPEPYGSFSGYLQLVGFGYDSSIDNYKVVRVFTNNDDSSIRLSDVKQWIEVFTLKKNNSWRRIPDIPFASISFNIRLEGTLANGSIYWLVMQEVDLNHTHNELLMGFDLACEEFRLVRLPDEPVQSKWDYNLIVVRGCLSMVEVYLESPFVVVWLLKEDGKKNEFWSKFMKIPNQDYFYSEPLCFTRSGEVLLSITYEDRFFELLVLYNRENLSCRKYSVCGTNLWCEARIFIETLVLPNRC